MTSWAAEAPDLQVGDVLKIQAKPSKLASKTMGMAGAFSVGGTVLMLMLAICPIWSAANLLGDFNYVFWAGRRVPTVTIVVCICIVCLFAITSGIFFGRAHAPARTEQTTMMVVNIFITLFGLFLMIASLPLTRQALQISSDLLHNCAYSEETHRLYEYSQVLQNIRATPACANKFSVEECAGYQASPPYTDFLKSLENEFLCAGFCYKVPATAKPAQLLGLKDRIRLHRTTLALAVEAAETMEGNRHGVQNDLHASATYPPTLFSDSNFQASCDGMAARNMQNVAGDIGQQLFFQGIYLVFIAVATGFLKLFGLCVRKS